MTIDTAALRSTGGTLAAAPSLLPMRLIDPLAILGSNDRDDLAQDRAT